MNKIIFQIGLLSFCVASVVFSTQGDDLLNIMARSFVVFIVVVCAIAGLLFVASSFSVRRTEPVERADVASSSGEAAGGTPQATV
jgi:hypothetical protein